MLVQVLEALHKTGFSLYVNLHYVPKRRYLCAGPQHGQVVGELIYFSPGVEAGVCLGLWSP